MSDDRLITHVHGSIWGPGRPKSYMERLKEEQELRAKEKKDAGEETAASVASEQNK